MTSYTGWAYVIGELRKCKTDAEVVWLLHSLAFETWGVQRNGEPAIRGARAMSDIRPGCREVITIQRAQDRDGKNYYDITIEIATDTREDG